MWIFAFFKIVPSLKRTTGNTVLANSLPGHGKINIKNNPQQLIFIMLKHTLGGRGNQVTALRNRPSRRIDPSPP
jgi:hypothetical protein